MRKLLIILFVLVSSAAFCQDSNHNSKWSNILYNHTSGPVSPEYQYSYSISVNFDASATLTYSKSGVTNNYEFTPGKKAMKKLNKALKKSNVFSIPADRMKSDKTSIGGQIQNATITMWQPSDVDRRPESIVIPDQVNDTYKPGIENLYKQIENLVPASIWEKAKSK